MSHGPNVVAQGENSDYVQNFMYEVLFSQGKFYALIYAPLAGLESSVFTVQHVSQLSNCLVKANCLCLMVCF